MRCHPDLLFIALALAAFLGACGDPCERAISKHGARLAQAAKLEPALSEQLPGVLVYPGAAGVVSQIAEACADPANLEPAVMRERRLTARLSRDGFCIEVGRDAQRYVAAHRRAAAIAMRAEQVCTQTEPRENAATGPEASR